VLAGADAVFSAACKQAGLIRVDTLEEAAIMAAALVNTPLPRGRRVGIITGGGGFGVIAADVSVKRGLDLVLFSDETIDRLRRHLPAWWSPNNPVDMVAGLGYGGPRDLIPVLMESGEIDGLILLGIGWVYSMLDAVNHPTDFGNIENELLRAHINNDLQYCETLAEYTRKWGKPLLMSSSVARLAIRRVYPGLKKILEQGIMIFPTIEDAIRVISALVERYEFLACEGAVE
jgi:acyl-CoA synthetase (NDP forming)